MIVKRALLLSFILLALPVDASAQPTRSWFHSPSGHQVVRHHRRFVIVSRHIIPVTGGTVRLRVRARVAQDATCRLRHIPGLGSVRFQCDTSLVLRVPRTTSHHSAQSGVVLVVRGKHRALRLRVPLRQRHVTTASLDPLPSCTPGADCYLPITRRLFPTWGNLRTGDCLFAAAADWEMLETHISPLPSAVMRSYHDEYNTELDFFTFWAQDGVAGVRALATSVPTSPSAVMAAIRSNRAVMATLASSTTQDTIIGPYHLPGPEGHEVVLDGFTPQGLRVITWGATYMLSWQEWARIGAGVDIMHVLSTQP